MKYTETRKIFAEDLRSLCIKMNWYTLGTNHDYARLLFDFTNGSATTEKLAQIAEDIKAHSETEYEITSIMFELARICRSFFEVEEAEAFS